MVRKIFKNYNTLLGILFLGLSMIMPGLLSAQTHKLTGYVLKASDTKTPIEDAYVLLIDKDTQRVVARTFSRSDGHFTLAVNLDKQRTYLLSFLLLGYERKSINIRSGEKLDELKVLLTEHVEELREVHVRARPIRKYGDTIGYNVHSFMRKSDRNLEDLISRLPGLNVDASGTILYNGLPINKFYIENMDLLGGRYGIATSSLSPEEVAKVEVFENHEPIRMMRKQRKSRHAAINIKLKNKAKSKWIGSAELGAGLPPLLASAKVDAQRFKSRSQTILLASGNNNGTNSFREILLKRVPKNTFFNPNRLGFGVEDEFTMVPTSPRIGKKDRDRFNESGIASLNHLIRLDEVSNLRFNVNVGYEQLRREYRRKMIFTKSLTGDTLILEDENLYHQHHFLDENELVYEYNGDNVFIKNKASFNLYLKKSDDKISFKENKIVQQFHLPQRIWSDRLSLSFALAGHVYKLENDLEYVLMPQRMSVVSGFDVPLNGDDEHQNNDSKLFNNDLKLSSSYKFWGQQMHFDWGWTHARYDLHAEMNPIRMTGESLWRQRSCFNRFYFKPKISFKTGLVETNVEAAFVALTHNIGGFKVHRTFLEPHINIVFPFLGKNKLMLLYMYSNDVPQLREYFTKVLRRDYRTYERGYDVANRGSIGKSHFATATYKFGDVSTGINGYFYSFMNYRKGVAISNNVENSYVYSYYTQDPMEHFSLNNKMNLSKYFLDQNLTLSLDLSNGFSRREIQQQSEAFSFRMYTYGLTPSLSWDPSLRFNTSYKVDCTWSHLKITDLDEHQKTFQMSQHFTPYWWLKENLGLSVTLDHYMVQSKVESTKHRLFLDAGLYLNLKQAKIRLEGFNLLNDDLMERVFYNKINTIVHSYHFRPREWMLTVKFKFSNRTKN